MVLTGGCGCSAPSPVGRVRQRVGGARLRRTLVVMSGCGPLPTKTRASIVEPPAAMIESEIAANAKVSKTHRIRAAALALLCPDFRPDHGGVGVGGPATVAAGLPHGPCARGDTLANLVAGMVRRVFDRTKAGAGAGRRG